MSNIEQPAGGANSTREPISQETLRKWSKLFQRLGLIAGVLGCMAVMSLIVLGH